MSDAFVDHEPMIRLAVFAGVFVLMAAWELAAPRREQVIGRRLRWTHNLALVVFNTVLLRLVFPTAAVGVALAAEARGWGLFNILAVAPWVAILLSVILLDLAIYLQHVMFHAVSALWRLHRLHHADLEFDVTTGLRFHPIEILLSMVIKLVIVAALGPSVAAVVIFEVLLNGSSMFNHGNVRLPGRVDRVLRWLLVTPDMHRVHHSVTPHETNSNFGFNVPWWDRLFGTYLAQPEEGHQSMTIGIEQFRTRRDLWLDRLLVQPFVGAAGDYPINRRER